MREKPQLAVDLGTANTVVYARGYGIVLFEATVASVDERTGEVRSVGRRMIGRAPEHLRTLRPLERGVVGDLETTGAMLRSFIGRLGNAMKDRATVAVCVPSGTTQVERNAVTEATLAAGASHVWLIEEALAAAIGAGLPVDEAVGSFVLDVGAGTTEIAIAACGGLVVSSSVRVGGDDLDAAIVQFLRKREHLLIGLEQAEALKIETGTALPGSGSASAEVYGRDIVTRLVRRAEVGPEDLRRAFGRPLACIVDAVNGVVESAPPELLADVAERGLVIVGGGALLGGLDELLRRETGLPVTVAEKPLTAVARGAGRALETRLIKGRGRRARDAPRPAPERSSPDRSRA